MASLVSDSIILPVVHKAYVLSVTSQAVCETLPENRSPEPVTVESLETGRRDLGVEAGGTVLVHSSLSSLGWVCGGPPAVVDALQRVVASSSSPSSGSKTTDSAAAESPVSGELAGSLCSE